MTSGRTGFFNRVPRPMLSTYAKTFKDWFSMVRRDGVLQVQMRTGKGPAMFMHKNGLWHDIWSQAWSVIGNDPENKVIIITGTGDLWLASPEEEEVDPSVLGPSAETPWFKYNHFHDALRNTQNIIFDVNVPTIGAINGPGIPGFHTEFALLCDITLCTDDTVLRDPHFEVGSAPGDGLGMVFQELLGTKRAAYYMYTGDPIDAHAALQLGLVNEVLPRDRLLPRAWEIATLIAQRPDFVRLMTKQIVRRPWQRRYVDDAAYHYAHEALGTRIAQMDADASKRMGPDPARRSRDRARAMIAAQRARGKSAQQ